MMTLSERFGEDIDGSRTK